VRLVGKRSAVGVFAKKIPCARLGILGIGKHDKTQKWGSLLMKQALLITKASSMQIGCFGFCK
jgi:hypothetical protein